MLYRPQSEALPACPKNKTYVLNLGHHVKSAERILAKVNLSGMVADE
jgi:hypothetical protein